MTSEASGKKVPIVIRDGTDERECVYAGGHDCMFSQYTADLS